MWPVSQMICMGILISLSIVDIYFRKIPTDILVMATISAVIYQIIERNMDLWLIAGGAGMGMLFFLFSKITREGFGYGDSWAIFILGIYLGLWNLVEVLVGAFFLVFVVSVVGLTVRKMSRRYKLPFFPFLAAGYLANILVGGKL